MAECLVPGQLSEYGYCAACERAVPAAIADPPPSLSLFDGLERAYDRRIATWELCPHCWSAVESLLADLDHLVPVRTGFDREHDHPPTACGRCGVRIDDDATLLDLWGHGVSEDWYTGLCPDCADHVHDALSAVPGTDPPGWDGVYWPPALSVPEADLVTASEADTDALRTTFAALSAGDTVRLAAYERGTIYSGHGQYLDVTTRVTIVEESPPDVDPGVVVDPVQVHRAYVAARTDPYDPDPERLAAPYRLDLGGDLDWRALPLTLDPGDVPVVRTDEAPLAVTVLDPDADDR